MPDKQPEFTNNDLVVIENRSRDTGLLLDLVPLNTTFIDEYNILDKIQKNNISNQGKWTRLGIMALSISQFNSIDNISALDLLEGRFEPYPYQLKAALNVLKEKSSIAMLADEVGLGKTIEVGIILKEHIVRNNIHSILIVTPKALIMQWQDEMREKFDEAFVTCEDEEFDYDSNRIIISFNKLSRNIEKIANRQWDMVIVDEAHMLINTTSKRRQAISSIDRRYMLLCTATPLCNKLTDLYSLVDLLYPGLLGTDKQFKKQYFEDRAGRVCKKEMKDGLKKIVSRVMVRTLRKESGIPFPERFVHSLRINGSREEYDLIGEALQYMKRIYPVSHDNKYNSAGKNRYLLLKEIISMQQSLSSSPRALIKSLQNRLNKYPDQKGYIESIIEKAEKITNYSKVRALIETLNNMQERQAVIFTLRLETAYFLSDILNENFMSARVYEGRLSGHERQDLVNSFRQGRIKYIVATDAAAEGLNLQSASVVVNYDLHWNPMKLEQRIGRVHRRGQEKDVFVVNIVIKDTIDDYVLKVLFEKIDLFKMTIGGIESVLTESDDEKGLEETILDILVGSRNQRNIKNELDKLRKDLEYKKEQNALREEFSSLVLD